VDIDKIFVSVRGEVAYSFVSFMNLAVGIGKDLEDKELSKSRAIDSIDREGGLLNEIENVDLTKEWGGENASIRVQEFEV